MEGRGGGVDRGGSVRVTLLEGGGGRGCGRGTSSPKLRHACRRRRDASVRGGGVGGAGGGGAREGGVRVEVKSEQVLEIVALRAVEDAGTENKGAGEGGASNREC